MYFSADPLCNPLYSFLNKAPWRNAVKCKSSPHTSTCEIDHLFQYSHAPIPATNSINTKISVAMLPTNRNRPLPPQGITKKPRSQREPALAPLLERQSPNSSVCPQPHRPPPIQMIRTRRVSSPSGRSSRTGTNTSVPSMAAAQASIPIHRQLQRPWMMRTVK